MKLISSFRGLVEICTHYFAPVIIPILSLSHVALGNFGIDWSLQTFRFIFAYMLAMASLVCVYEQTKSVLIHQITHPVLKIFGTRSRPRKQYFEALRSVNQKSPSKADVACKPVLWILLFMAAVVRMYCHVTGVNKMPDNSMFPYLSPLVVPKLLIPLNPKLVNLKTGITTRKAGLRQVKIFLM